MFRGKKYKESAKLVDRSVQYDPTEALDLVVKGASAKFDETVEIHIKLGVDSRHADQQVRGAVVLPNGTGKTARVLVFAKDAKVDEATAAGADYVGGMELVEKITKENWFEFDVVVASPDMMGVVGRLGKVLGPKGLMPSPKAGTVTPNVGAAVKEIKAGKVEYRLDKTNIIHCPIGKVSFGAEKLMENMDTLVKAVVKAKPAAAKGQYIRSCTVVSTMGPGVKVSTSSKSLVDLCVLGEDQHASGLTGAVGQNHGATDLLVSVTGVNTQLDVQLDSLVELCGSALHNQLQSFHGIVLNRAINQFCALLVLFTSKQCNYPPYSGDAE